MKPIRYSEPAAAAWLTPLEPSEFRRRLEAALAELNGPEGENLASLIRWFSRRYPTAGERLRYARRKHDEWRRWATVTSSRSGHTSP